MSNTLHTVGFKVQKYGSQSKKQEHFLNVMEDNVFDAWVFEFGIGMSKRLFLEDVFEEGVFETEVEV